MSICPEAEVQVEVKIHTRSTHMQYKPTQLPAQLHNTTAFERISPGTEHDRKVSQANSTIQDVSVWSFTGIKHFSYKNKV